MNATLTYYLAAPYSAPTREGIEANVLHAVQWWRRLADAGYMVVLPHTSDLLDALTAQHFGPEFYYDYTLKLMRRCDAVVLVPDGPTPRAASRGVNDEIAEAVRIGMPVVEVAELLGEDAS